jgi:hypothetical protein
MKESPESLYKRLAESDGLLEKQKNRYIRAWNDTISQKVKEGKLLDETERHDFSIEKFISSIKDVYSLPYNQILAIIRKEIEESMSSKYLTQYRRYKKQIARNLFVGYFPIDIVNASVKVSNDKSYIILINEGLIYITYYLSQVYAARCKMLENNTGDSDLEYDIEFLQKHVKSFFKAYMSEGVFPSGKDIFLPPQQSSLASIVEKYVLIFAVAHEFGHIIDNLGKKKLRKVVIAGITVDVIRKNWEVEMNADIVGLDILFANIFRKVRKDRITFHVQLGIIAILIFFRAAKSLENLFRTENTTHPPATERLQTLFSLVDEAFSPYVKVALDIDKIFDIIFSSLDVAAHTN